MTLKNKIELIEKEEIIKALEESGFVIVHAARKLGITERMIGYKIKKYKIRIIKYSDGFSKSISIDTANKDIKNNQL
jgi:transcriptional regulator with GAF, ATPase, and Fis domain